MQKQDRNISIITNFGCDHDCWYCIWKQHPDQHMKQETDWQQLEQFLVANQSKGKVSVSGGGDPLYNYQNNKEWWERLLDLCEKYAILVDIHTRTKIDDSELFERINRVCFSVEYIDIVANQDYLEWLSIYTKVRLVNVIGRVIEYLPYLVTICKMYKYQLTFKPLIGFDGYLENFNKCKHYYRNKPEIIFLDNIDYNIYYFPDNSIRTEFIKGMNNGTKN